MSGASVDDLGDRPPRDTFDPADLEELHEHLDGLSEDDTSSDLEGGIRETKALLAEAHERGLIDSGVRRLRASDAAEAFVGSVIFASPLLVEDGVFDIADHLFGFTVSGVPIFLIANTLFVVLMTHALLEWTGRDTEETHLILGRVPTRLVMNLLVSFLVAALLMTVWGRVGDWQPPSEALARINVLWTVGSLGAALGDILSEGERSPTASTAKGNGNTTARDASTAGERATTTATMADGETRPAASKLNDVALIAAIHERFDVLQSIIDDGEDRRDVQRVEERTRDAVTRGGFNGKIRKYTGRDIAEAFVGSIFFSIPFLVEDGVFDVAEYFLSFRIGQFPVFFLVNAAFVLLMVGALVYWAGPRKVEISRPLFGIVPRRMVGIALVSFLTTAALMTMWGRVANWQDPVVAVARVSVVWTVASFGASLGDVLPGESSGDDINDDLGDLSDRMGELIEQAE